jgi:hypothetical protein
MLRVVRSHQLSGLVPHALGIAQKDLEFCDIMTQNPEPIVYTLVISRKIMTPMVIHIRKAPQRG